MPLKPRALLLLPCILLAACVSQQETAAQKAVAERTAQVSREKHCGTFGYKPGTFSYKHGVVDVADTLHYALARAIREGDEALASRVFEYAQWADTQKNARHLRSAVDILFFIKLLLQAAY